MGCGVIGEAGVTVLKLVVVAHKAEAVNVTTHQQLMGEMNVLIMIQGRKHKIAILKHVLSNLVSTNESTRNAYLA